MNLSFDYYNNLEKVELYLCNPDGRELFPVVGQNRKLNLRFNDLSELSFEVYSTTSNYDGSVTELECYDYLEMRRLIYATGIGWFVITKVKENDNGVVKYKALTCDSLQATFKDRGFVSEERVYYFYNPSDPKDDAYDSKDDESIPSVIGQLYQQLGIKQLPSYANQDIHSMPVAPYDDWTITYISPYVRDEDATTHKQRSRNFKEETTYGYDWMVKSVEDAFEVIFLFDFMYKTIKIVAPDEVTEKSSVIFTFSNFMKEVVIDGSSDDVITVMNCNGSDCDITQVNPTGTNYICDFSYFMDEEKHRWMSDELIQAIKDWKNYVNRQDNKDAYINKINELKGYYKQKADIEAELKLISTRLQDLKVARDKKITNPEDGYVLTGTVLAERVNIGEKSKDSNSKYYSTNFTENSQIEYYTTLPKFDSDNPSSLYDSTDPKYRKWWWNNTAVGTTASASSAYSEGADRYFFDDKNNASYTKSYCKLEGKAKVNANNNTTTYEVSGFARYIAYDISNEWVDIYERIVASKNSDLNTVIANISSAESNLREIANRCNILKYFANAANFNNDSSTALRLYKELTAYWIEGDYTNENIAVLEDTTDAEAIDLQNELFKSGEIELSKVCQPKYTFSLTAVDCMKNPEFVNQMSDIELGKIITVEKEEGLWYYPALLEIELDLDTVDSFTLSFANALRLDKWGFTYGDLITQAVSTSRKVSANWQDLTCFAKGRVEYESLIKGPLESALRASFANAKNQEFTVDDTGILGRKLKVLPSGSALNENDSPFENEQIRIINNQIIFTDDGWENASLALGKITVGNQHKYGLIADTIIGSLILGEQLSIKNSDSSVSIGAGGIQIKHGNSTVFSADTLGNLTVTGYATEGSVSSLTTTVNGINSRVTTAEGKVSSLEQTANTISASVSSKLDKIKLGKNNNGFGWSLTDTVFDIAATVNGTYIDVLTVDKNGLTVYGSGTFTGTVYANKGSFTGTVYANEGVIGGCTISNNHLSIDSAHISSLSVDLINGATLNANSSKPLYSPYTVFGANDGSYHLRIHDANLGTATTIAYADGDYSNDAWITLGNQYSIPYIFIDVYATTNQSYIDIGSRAHLMHLGTDAAIAGTDSTRGYLQGFWSYSNSPVVSSDQNAKHDIIDVQAKYGEMFDLIRPRLFKYNNGLSDRKHLGFIAQEVDEAREKATISRKDLALICIDNEGTEKEAWGLRYSEFVALNTWQIQKLKDRVAQLEKRIAELEK